MKQVEVVTGEFDSILRTNHLKCDSAEQALSGLRVPLAADCFVLVSISDGNVSLGEFELWCSGQRAWARILEHREYEARELENAEKVLTSDVTFKDGADSTFTVPGERTVPRELAVAALLAWLRGRARPAMFVWDSGSHESASTNEP